MRLIAVVTIALLCCLVHAEELTEPFSEIPEQNFDEYASLLELAQKSTTAEKADPALVTYLPESGPYDNPATDTTPTPAIPSSPSCTIRSQTIFEIKKMRSDAKQIGMSIMYEIQTMEKRKAYIEQMTNYLNDRIRELNKVKKDLAAEQKWIALSNKRITELAQKEKLIKLQDIMSCINSEQERLAGEKGTKSAALASMSKQAAEIEKTISGIRKSMKSITGGAAASKSKSGSKSA